LQVQASDKGLEPLYAVVDVELDVVDRNNKPPVWDSPTYGPIFVRENVTVGTVVTSVKARYVSTPVELMLSLDFSPNLLITKNPFPFLQTMFTTRYVILLRIFVRVFENSNHADALFSQYLCGDICIDKLHSTIYAPLFTLG